MDEDRHHHEELIKGISKQLEGFLESSQQAVYFYLDDVHKVCDRIFASLLGYPSPEAWVKVEESFPQAFAKRDSRENW